jgi:uncharacterized protein
VTSRFKSRLERRKGERPRELQPQSQHEPQPQPEQAVEAPISENRSAVLDELRRRMERIAARSRPVVSPPSEKEEARELPGAEVETAFGPVHVRTVTYPRGHRHGREPIDAFLEAGEHLAALAKLPKLADAEPSGALFLDTETTGLAGGTGTLPFLVGVARFDENGALIVEQFLCRDPSEERAQLELLIPRLMAATHLVTFNGRAFDMPLVNTRFVMHRLSNPGYALMHLDLLHVARRIFGRRLDDRSLGSLERAVLGFQRVGDIPGAEIPAAYGAFLRGGPVAPMVAILEHNALDLVALAALGGLLARMYADPEAVEHAADHLGLARAAFAFGQREMGDRHLADAAEFGRGDDKTTALHMAAAEATKRRDFERARDLLLEIVASQTGDAFAHLALAKLYEHRLEDTERAAYHAVRAAEAEGEDASIRRLERLRRKGLKKE